MQELQRCWGRVCLPARQCTSTSRSWHSRASAQWDTLVHQSWHVASQQSWPKPGWLLHLWHDAQVCILSTNLQWGWVVAAACLEGVNFSTAWWMMQLIPGKKDWESASMQMVITLNTYCDVAFLAFNAKEHNRLFSQPPVPHNTTCLFTAATKVWRETIHSIRRMSSAFHKAVWWHFQVWWASSQLQLPFVFSEIMQIHINIVEKWVFESLKVTWLQLTDEVGKSMSCWHRIFSVFQIWNS